MFPKPETIGKMTPWQIIEEALGRRRPPRKPQWLGDQLGVTAQVLTNWKSRQVPPSRFREIAGVLGLTVDQLEGLAPLPWDATNQAWPFVRIGIERFTALDKEDRAYVEGRLISAIEECEKNKATQAEFLATMETERKAYFPKPKYRKTSNS